jgi:hypothetical protein
MDFLSMRINKEISSLMAARAVNYLLLFDQEKMADPLYY